MCNSTNIHNFVANNKTVNMETERINLKMWAKASGYAPIKITEEDFVKSINNVEYNSDWRIVEFNYHFDFDYGIIEDAQVFHKKTNNSDDKTIFVFLRMFGPQIDEYNTSIESNITCSTPMVVQFDIDESATQYTGKIEDYFEGIPRAESGPRY